MKPSVYIKLSSPSYILILIFGLVLAACSGQTTVSTQEEEEPEEETFGCEHQIVEVNLNHIWAFSPGGDPDNGAIHTTATGSCLIEVNEGNLANISSETLESGDPCLYSYEMHGEIKTDDGMCEVHGSAIAQVEISGSCSFGYVEVLILESLSLPGGVDPVFGFDVDSSGVTIQCPGMEEPQEYIKIFPLSSFGGEFHQSAGEQQIQGSVVCPDNSFIVCNKTYTARTISAQ